MLALRLILISASVFVAARGAEAPVLSEVRQKLRAKVLAAVPPPPPPKPMTEGKKAEDSAIVMNPVVVTESKLIQRVTAAMEQRDQDRRNETFSPLDGGKIAKVGPMEIGSWWLPGEGWTFLRLNKAPTRRQIEASEARMKELKELQDFGKGGAKAKP